MQTGSPLSDFYKDYSTGNLGKKEFEALIFQYVLESGERFALTHWERDECIDFLCWLYPRFSRAIDTYQDTGSSFDAYLGSLIRWSVKEYRHREADHQITEKAAWNARKREVMMACEEEPEYLGGEEKIAPVNNPRQILLLLLKSYHCISGDFAERIAPAIGMEKEKLIALIDQMRTLRERREKEIQTLKERISSLYYRCIAYEERMFTAEEGSAHHELMKKYCLRGKKRLAGMRQRLAAIRIEASNRQVAEVLGIPKGTVDAGIFAIKKRYT